MGVAGVSDGTEQEQPGWAHDSFYPVKSGEVPTKHPSLVKK